MAQAKNRLINLKNSILNIKNMYILMLLTVAGWSVFGYLTIQQEIEEQSAFAELINLAGKQRMLSQKTALMTVRIELQNESKFISHRDGLLTKMFKEHQYIVSNLTSDSLQKIYFEAPYALDEKVKHYLRLFENSSGVDGVQTILNYSHQLLPTLDHAVNAFQTESERRSQVLGQREVYIVIGTFLTLFLEAVLIVLPIFRRMLKKEHEFEGIFNYAPVPIVMVNLKGESKQRNAAFVEFCRGDQSALDNFTCRLSFSHDKHITSEQDQNEQAQRLWIQQLDAAKKRHGVLKPELYTMVFEDGSNSIVEISGRLANDEIVVTINDLTEKELAKAQIQTVTELLNQSQKIAKLGSWSLDLQTQQLIWSDEIYMLFELDPLKFTPSYESFLSAIHPEDVSKVNAAFELSLQQHVPYLVEHRLLMTDGRVKYVREQGHTEYDEDGNGLFSTGTVQDITEQKIIQDALDKEREKYKNIMALSSDGLFILTPDEGKLVEYSQVACQLLGYSDEEMQALSVMDWDKGFSSLDEYRQLTRQIGYDPITIEREHTRKDGSTYKASMTAVRINLNGEEFLSASVRDVTERYKLLEKIKAQSVTDELTQLKNRRAFHDHMEDVIQQYGRHGIVFSIMMLDIDHFKSVNDTYGHQVGDEVLIALSQEMVSNVRKTDSVYRLGGEEFVILLTGTPLKAAAQVAEELKAAVQKNVRVIKGREITISIGVAEFGEADTFDSLLKRADDNLYRAKELGRNRVVSISEI